MVRKRSAPLQDLPQSGDRRTGAGQDVGGTWRSTPSWNGQGHPASVPCDAGAVQHDSRTAVADRAARSSLAPILEAWKLKTGGVGPLFTPKHPTRGGRSDLGSPAHFVRPETVHKALTAALKACDLAQAHALPSDKAHVRIPMGDERRKHGGARQNPGPFVYVHDRALRAPCPGLFRSQGVRHGGSGSYPSDRERGKSSALWW